MSEKFSVLQKMFWEGGGGSVWVTGEGELSEGGIFSIPRCCGSDSAKSNNSPHLWGIYCVPGTDLSTFYQLTLIFRITCDEDTVITPILQMKKLRHTGAK